MAYPCPSKWPKLKWVNLQLDGQMGGSSAQVHACLGLLRLAEPSWFISQSGSELQLYGKEALSSVSDVRSVKLLNTNGWASSSSS
ncbi:hypothetical protein SAY87_004748 [Trapa incisa]|uniref:Uncharacterized protein n=1 Tax=Trapa incisa TaxID=236973 RepID=A0AAN7JPH3_9MYRT|nr:hypothetical protein SAY87_004748 [Trapa incisa]